jgi:hypothetical protein
MLTRKLTQLALLLIVFVFSAFATLGQQFKDGEVQALPTAAKERIFQYFTYLKKRDYANLYEIDDWDIRNKEDYIAIHVTDETSPYRKFRSLLEVGLEGSMRYFASSNKWEIAGCSRLIDMEGNEILAESSVFLTDNKDRGWIIGDSSIKWYRDGFHKCQKNFKTLPIKISATG